MSVFEWGGKCCGNMYNVSTVQKMGKAHSHNTHQLYQKITRSHWSRHFRGHGCAIGESTRVTVCCLTDGTIIGTNEDVFGIKFHTY